MASRSGTLPVATSFCIELRKPLGSPSSAVRIGSGATLAPSATPTAQASLTHCSKLAHRYGDSLLMRRKAVDELDLSIREWCL